ncbi:MAG: hypothetical protein ACUVRM_05530 [Bacillota bacterium]
MLNFLGLCLAVLVAFYTFVYAFHIWRGEKNPLGALVVGGLGLAAILLPVYVLYLHG